MPIFDEDVLEHYGVKGMRWGIRKKEDSGSDSSGAKETSSKKTSSSTSSSSSGTISTSDVQAAVKANSKPLTSSQRASVAANKRKAQQKFEDPADSEGDSSEGWRPTKKQVALIGVGVVAAGALIYGYQTGKEMGKNPFSVDEYKNVLGGNKSPEWLTDFAGKKIAPDAYDGFVQDSMGRIWGNGTSYLTHGSFDAPEMTFPTGHTFYRLSNSVEKGFKGATYMTNNEADFARYLATTEFGSKANMVTFSATKPLRVPDLHTRLDVMRQMLVEERGGFTSPRDVISSYSGICGGNWSSPRAQSFISRLRELGYDAIIDDMDAGVLGQSPMVLFSGDGMSSKTVTSMSNIDRSMFTNMLTEITNRR